MCVLNQPDSGRKSSARALFFRSCELTGFAPKMKIHDATRKTTNHATAEIASAKPPFFPWALTDFVAGTTRGTNAKLSAVEQPMASSPYASSHAPRVAPSGITSRAEHRAALAIELVGRSWTSS